jgi:hypothetical protein
MLLEIHEEFIPQSFISRIQEAGRNSFYMDLDSYKDLLDEKFSKRITEIEYLHCESKYNSIRMLRLKIRIFEKRVELTTKLKTIL